MARWEPNARGRLEQAALELFAERGFEQTTVDEIARRAGLTERTFFRHFADKREVLFGGQSSLLELLIGGIASAPPDATPIGAVTAGLRAITPMFEHRLDQVRQRQAIIDAHPELQERELIKLAFLADAVTGALRDRGVPSQAASLAAQAGIAVFKIAFARWVTQADGPDPDGNPPGLAGLMQDSLDELRAVSTAR